jgi:hypothetical protein
MAAVSEPLNFAKVLARYREPLKLATELGMRPLVAHGHLGLGKLYRRTDKREQAGSISLPRRRCTERWGA